MDNTFLLWLVKQYAGKISAIISQLALLAVGAFLAWLGTKIPGLPQFAAALNTTIPAITISVAGALIIAIHVWLTILSNDLRKTNPKLADILDAIVAAKVLPYNAPKTIDLPHASVTITPVQRAGPPISEHP